MQDQKTSSVGVDIQDNRYIMCILNPEGKSPSYARGRVDTPKGQEKFFSKIPSQAKVLLPSSEFASLVYHHLGDQMVLIKDETEYYCTWEKAGIQRGDPMARFAAKLLFELNQETKLSEREIAKLLATEEEELLMRMQLGESSQEIIQRVLDGSATDKDVKQALKNQLQSSSSSLAKKDTSKKISFLEDDESFLAELFRFIASLH